jgi:hypothetical protein
MAIGAHRRGAVLASVLFTGVLVLVTWLAGCGAGGSQAPTPTATPPAQSWQQALGPGVTVTKPVTTAPGFGSPGAAVQGIADAETAAGCRYFEPSAQAECRKIFTEVPSADLGTDTGFSLGYVAVDGDRALVGAIGTQCQPGQHPECVTNRDPAAIFSTAQSFAALWAESIASANTSVFSYALTPCVRIAGRWYLVFPTGTPNPD